MLADAENVSQVSTPTNATVTERNKGMLGMEGREGREGRGAESLTTPGTDRAKIISAQSSHAYRGISWLRGCERGVREGECSPENAISAIGRVYQHLSVASVAIDGAEHPRTGAAGTARYDTRNESEQAWGDR